VFPSRSDLPSGFPFPLIGALSSMGFCQCAGRDDRAFTAPPALLAFVKFAGEENLGMVGFAIAAMATVQIERHGAIVRDHPTNEN
jgi:hypothetical protein